MKRILKSALWGVFLVLAFPMAILSGLGRSRTMFALFAQTCAIVPGLPGDYLRIAYYKLTLAECALSSRISFGSFFSNPQARLSRAVYVGSFCIIGKAVIGERTQIASGVQILSGSRQHARDAEGRILGAEQGVFAAVEIGSDCWIGAAAVVMNDVGPRSTIGAGSIVTRPIPADSIAVGVPAKVIGSAAEHRQTSA